MEALEPEPRSRSRGGLGRLLSSMIPRTTAARPPEDAVRRRGEHGPARGRRCAGGSPSPRSSPISAHRCGEEGQGQGRPADRPRGDQPRRASPARATSLPELLGENPLGDNRSGGPARFRRRSAAPPAVRPPRAGHRRADARADRPGALHRQPLVREAGLRDRRRRRRALGARVTLVAGPVALADPARGRPDRRRDRRARWPTRSKKALPADVAVMVAAVADWRSTEYASEKIKKRGSAPPALLLTENPDILASVASRQAAPQAAGRLRRRDRGRDRQRAGKRKRKAADWIVANDVSEAKRDGRRRQHASTSSPPRGRRPGRNAQGSRSALAN